MMITLDNLNQNIDRIPWHKYPKELKQAKNEIPQLLEFYHQDKGIQKTVDLFIKQVNRYSDKIENKPKMPVSIKILKHYIRYGNTQIKTKAKLESILKDLQKQIGNRQINSKSPFSGLVLKVQDDLVKRLNTGSYKTLTKETIEKILSKTHITKIKNYGINNIAPSKSLTKTKSQNMGIKRSTSKPKKKQSLTGIKTASELRSMAFEVFDMGVFNTLFGKPSLPFYAMIHGKPGSGKSTFALMLSGYLASKGKQVLYVSKEEGYTATMQDKLNRLGIDSSNLYLTDYLVDNWPDYDFIFIDSASSLRLNVNNFNNLIQAAKQKKVSLFFIFQATKAGDFRGSLEYEHEVDVSLIADSGTVNVGKNRFGGDGKMKVF